MAVLHGPWHHGDVEMRWRRVCIGMVAGLVVALHAMAVPSAAGACADASLHHVTGEVTPGEDSANPAEQVAEAQDALAARDIRTPLPEARVVSLVQPSTGLTEVRPHGFVDVPPPDHGALSIWRT